jgi:hypothetical protein
MKKFLFTFLLAVTSVAAGAQTGRAFYMYQHGGSIAAFTKSTIDSITYSNEGTDGKTYEDAVTQLIYTKDSLYKIPLSEIDSVSFLMQSKNDTITPGEAIDLGLSVKWASCNVGTTSPEGFGGYYSWGETEVKSNYSESTYKYYDSSTNTYIDIGSDISGTEYDVAHVKWGGSWRMPTHKEMYELCYKCKYEWITYNGVNGAKFTGPNGNSIFLPATGLHLDTAVAYDGNWGYYWSASIYNEDSRCAWNIHILSSKAYPSGYDYQRRYAFSVRPVTK